jgi:AraC-like DNA-binding protein
MEGRRTRHASHHDAIGGFTATTGEPDPQLRSYVREYEDYADFTPGASTRREVPAAHAVVIISFGEPYDVIDPRDASRGVRSATFITGLYDSYVDNASPGPTRGIQVNLTPLGEYRLLGMPMHEIANRAVDVRDAFGPAGRRLVERLQAARNSDARFDILDEVFTARMQVARSPSEGVAWAYRQLASSGGRTPIGALTDELGWSRKRLVAQFREQIGLPPKTVARIVRFSGAVRLIGEGHPPGAGMAYRCGYYDQAHFIREFGAFAGATPREFRALQAPPGAITQVTSVQDR